MKLKIEEIQVINNRLRAFDAGWVKSKDSFGNKPAQSYLDHQTITQILNYATYGITTWDFDVVEQWREDVHKKDKQSQQWVFDGYVYHVKGALTIHGLGTRTQFGKKVAAGGATGQDMSYQSAASNALSKCASLFGVGETLYVPQHQVISQDFMYQETVNLLGHLQQKQVPQQQVLPSLGQQAYVDPVAQEVERTLTPTPEQLAAQQQVQQPVQQQQPEWAQSQQNAFVNPQVDNNLPTAFGAPQQTNAQANWDTQQQVWAPPTDMNIHPNSAQPTQADVQFMQENQVPFGDAQTQPQMSQQAAPQQVQMPEQPAVMGSPIIVNQPVQEVHQEPIQVQGSDEQQKFMQQITTYNQHKTRLGYTDDSQMLPYLRDYFKDENASTANLNMESIVGFNEYMLTVQV